MPVDGDIILKAGLDTAGVTKSIHNLSKSISKSLKNAIRIGFGVRSIFALIRKLRTALFEGFKDLAQVHAPFNEAMSEIMTSLRLLRNTFAAAFAPIVETVAPILSSFINLMAKAIASVGQFIAALTGKEYVQAGTVQVDYAESVNKSTKSTDKATSATKKQTKAQKELNKEITHFDDLVILHSNRDDDDTTEPVTTSTPQSAFTTMPIGNAVSQFVKDFKAAWANADFTDIGRQVGEKLKNALENIPWTGIKATLAKIGKSIATFLNGFMETPGLYYTIGKTIAEGINSAFEFVYAFVSNFHWDSWGRAIQDKILGLLENIDWQLIYNTMITLASGLGTALSTAFTNSKLWTSIFYSLANGINVLVSSLQSFLNAVQWRDLGDSITTGLRNGMYAIRWRDVYALAGNFGTSLANFLNGLFNPNTFAEVGATVSRLLNSAFEFLNHFGETFDFKNFGSSLAAGINGFLNNFNTARLTSGINTLVTGFRDAVVSFLGKVNWYDFGVKLREIIKNIPWKIILFSVGTVIWEAINSAIQLLKGLFDTDNITNPFTEALEKLQTTINNAAEQIDFAQIADGIDRIVKAIAPAAAGFGAGLLYFFDKIVEIGAELLEKIGPALQKMADALNELDPETLEKIGTALGLIAGSIMMFAGINTIIGIISTFIQTIQGIVGATALAIGTAGGAAGVGAGGILGLIAVIGLLGAAMAGTIVGVASFTEEIAGTEEELGALNDAHQTAIDVVQEVGRQYGLTSQQVYELAWQMEGAIGETADAEAVYALLNGTLEESGINVDAFKSSLQDAATTASLQGKDISTIQSYIDGVSESSTTAAGETSAFSGTFEAFNSLGWTVPVKMGLLSAAVDSLGESGKLSDEDVKELHKTLDNYNTKPTEENMAKIQKALEDTGISAEDFSQAWNTAIINADGELKKELSSMVTELKTQGPNLKTGSENAAKNVTKGFVEESKKGKSEIKKEMKSSAEDAISEFDAGLGNNSPSRKTRESAGNVISGFVNGINTGLPHATESVRSLAQQILTAFDSYQSSYVIIGQNIVSSIAVGVSNSSYTLMNAINQIGYSMQNDFKALSWESLGHNIGLGIYNGLLYYSGTLEVLAWNTAVDMYNSACRALSIASPSKKFAYIGEMVAKGLGKGVEDNQDVATDAVVDMTDAMTTEAEKTNPTVAITSSVDNWINSLDDVLTTFSETIIDKFDAMMSTLIQLGNVSGYIPAVAQGKVIPSSVRASSNSSNNTANMMRMLENLTANQMTTEDLRPLLIELFRDYMNFGWYIGDEQLARHVNNGNLSLGRRYSK